MNLIRLFHTIRQLKPVQVYGRLSFALKRKLLTTGSPGTLSKLACELKGQLPLDRNNPFDLRFLNRQQQFVPAEMKWQSHEFDENNEKLWLYHLNYFNWLFDGQLDNSPWLKLFLILDWIEKNNSSRSETWEPYVVSRRIYNWVLWLQQNINDKDSYADCVLQSLSGQCKRLWSDLEYHNQANHLLENLRALYVATVFLAEEQGELSPEFEQRLEFCAKELISQIRLQFFADGGHFERSPMYHLEMLDAVEAVKLANRRLLKLSGLDSLLMQQARILETLCEDKIPLMRDWLAVMTHPDGKIAQFNDATLSVGISRKGKPMNYLLDSSGFFVRRTDDSYFALSCGDPSPAFQPGHTHCDIMSFELSLAGQRCIVDTGCGSYQNPQIREECRHTAAHNLPMIEHAEQSDIWEQFRIGKRARVVHTHFDSEHSRFEIELLDQYGQRFRREVIFTVDSIKVRDRMFDRRVTGTFVSLLHLAPQVQIIPGSESGAYSFAIGETEFKVITSSRVRVESYIWYPDFGMPVNAEQLILSNHQTEAIDYVITWKTA
ncbi:MAG: heparinase II/III family protein [Candidatus Riflebacteria bacterium]|nr:heparinase II/III family protein [Candidatus Riflebacteria bacterium]